VLGKSLCLALACLSLTPVTSNTTGHRAEPLATVETCSCLPGYAALYFGPAILRLGAMRDRLFLWECQSTCMRLYAGMDVPETFEETAVPGAPLSRPPSETFTYCAVGWTLYARSGRSLTRAILVGELRTAGLLRRVGALAMAGLG
jgi:hypothetical protein